jgi:hypothetical protein
MIPDLGTRPIPLIRKNTCRPRRAAREVGLVGRERVFDERAGVGQGQALAVVEGVRVAAGRGGEVGRDGEGLGADCGGWDGAVRRVGGEVGH